MRIITGFFIIISLAVCLLTSRFFKDTRALNKEIKKVQNKITMIDTEYKSLAKYKDSAVVSLSRFYVDVFNNIKQISVYYNSECRIKIIGCRDLVSIEEFFKPSEYKGVRCVDVLSQLNLEEPSSVYLFEMFYEMAKTMPLEITEVKIEKNTVNLTTRLYGL